MKLEQLSGATVLRPAQAVKNKLRVGQPPIRRASDYRPLSQADEERQNRTINAMFRATWGERE